MTRNDFMIKWGVYALALLPVWLLEVYVLSRFPLMGVAPMLLPQAAIVVAVLEGPNGGGGFGLFTGLLYDAVYSGLPGAMTIGLTLLGVAAGALARYGLRQSLAGGLLCSLGALAIVDGLRVVVHLVRGVGETGALLRVAGLEILWSMVFVVPLYLLFRWVYLRVPKKTVL